MNGKESNKCHKCKHAIRYTTPEKNGEWISCSMLRRTVARVRTILGHCIPYRVSPADCPLKR